MIKINRQVAEMVTYDKLREQRKPLLNKLDLDFIRALEVGLDTKDISSTKQALRDVTKADLSDLTIEELIALDIYSAVTLPDRVVI